MSKIYLYPVWVRLWHLLNAILFLLLIFTGISLHFAGRVEGVALIRFDTAVSLHNISAIILTINYIYYLIGNVLSGNNKHYKVRKENFFANLFVQFRFYAVGMFRKEDHPFPVTKESKFNPLQKISYVIVMYCCMPILILSGIGLFFPNVLLREPFGVSGLVVADLIHIAIGFFLSVFLVIHIYTCTLGHKPTTLFKSMINGYHEH